MEPDSFKACVPPALCCECEGFPVRSLLCFLGPNILPSTALPSKEMRPALSPLCTHAGPKQNYLKACCFGVFFGQLWMQLAPTLLFFNKEFCLEANRAVEGDGWKAQL